MRIKKVVSLLLVLVLTLGLYWTVVLPATQDEIEESINAGIAWLASQQNADGSWGYSEEVAKTGFAVVKLEDRAFETGYDPFDPDYEYSDEVISGLNYIFDQAEYSTCGDGSTVIFKTFGHETYNTGVAMMAIAASRAPNKVVSVPGSIVDGWTYKEVIQASVDYFECAQNNDGAWRYWYTNEPSDNSNTGYAVLGLRYAEEFGVALPQSAKDDLSDWLDYIQNDTNGGSGYTMPTSWVNLLKTGNLLFEFEFVGDEKEDARVQHALDYVEAHWMDNNPDPGWRNFSGHPHYQAAYCLMKGLEAMSVETINVGGSDIDWFDEMSTRIVDTQNADGSWPSDYWGNTLLTTEWALLTLERVVPMTRVYVDVKPTSCPNPVNTKSGGVLPVAILGTEDFDVTKIDPETIRIESMVVGVDDVAPLRWALEDVAAPYIPEIDPEEPQLACTTEGPDGFMDLTVKFRHKEVVAALGEVEDGDVIMLKLTGKLQEEFGGKSFSGEDVIVILDKAKGKPTSNAFALRHVLATPNPVSSVDQVYFSVAGEGIVAMEVKVFSLAGAKLFDSGTVAGTSYSWDLVKSSGGKLANGLYLAVVTAEGIDQSSDSKVLKLFVVR